jgi:hypothetical protein
LGLDVLEDERDMFSARLVSLSQDHRETAKRVRKSFARPDLPSRILAQMPGKLDSVAKGLISEPHPTLHSF